MLINKTYTKSAYELDAFEELVPLEDDFILATLVLANNADVAILVEVDLADSEGNQLAIIVPSYSLASKQGQVLDVRSIGVTTSHVLRVKAASVGVSFTASGVVSQ